MMGSLNKPHDREALIFGNELFRPWTAQCSKNKTKQKTILSLCLGETLLQGLAWDSHMLAYTGPGM